MGEVKWKVWVSRSCPTLCYPMDCSPPSFSVHGILQARILEWVAISSSRQSFWHRDQTHVSGLSCFAGRFFTTAPPVKPNNLISSLLSQAGSDVRGWGVGWAHIWLHSPAFWLQSRRPGTLSADFHWILLILLKKCQWPFLVSLILPYILCFSWDLGKGWWGGNVLWLIGQGLGLRINFKK